MGRFEGRHLRKTLTAALLFFASSVRAGRLAEATDCTTIYPLYNGWVIEVCQTATEVALPMEVTLDGLPQGSGGLVRVAHQAQGGGVPQVMVLYGSGFLRLKPNADPAPPLPFGASFVLGPAFWSDDLTYHHSPTLTRVAIVTDGLPRGALRLHAEGGNGAFDVTYDLSLPPPLDRLTRLHVVQKATARSPVTIPPSRRTRREGFKLVQVSGMFINRGGVCDGGLTDCHDSDAVRFLDREGIGREVDLAALSRRGLIFDAPTPLGNNWLDVLHTDDEGWQAQVSGNGNTPNVRIALEMLPGDHTITPQGNLADSNNPNDENLGVWIHDDGPASVSWSEGQTGEIAYWLAAQDDPPDPLGDLGLRPGPTFLDFEGEAQCFPLASSEHGATALLSREPGGSGLALHLAYDLGASSGSWAQARCNFDPPLDLSSFDHLRFEWAGNAKNSLQVGLINPAGGGGESIFARGFHHVTHRSWPNRLVLPFDFLEGWEAGTAFDPSRVSAIFVSVVKDPKDDAGGAGRLILDNLGAFDVAGRDVPELATAVPDPALANRVAQWLRAQQQPTGLLRSWQEEPGCVAHLYDQALALLVFSNARRWPEAAALVSSIIRSQNADGSWPRTRDCATGALLSTQKWEGDIAWTVYALGRYLAVGGRGPAAETALAKGAAWLRGRVNLSGDGCLKIDHTEATLDAWWALQGAGRASARAAAALQNCLLTSYWDERMGRFKGGRTWWQPYLDNQTWGAAFLQAIGRREQASRALTYAWAALRLPAQDGHLFGLDGQGGPWAVWNEGGSQYVAVGGPGSASLLPELVASLGVDGSMPGGPDDFAGGGVWITRWHGVAPSAWLYFALAGGPFHPAAPATPAPPPAPSLIAPTNNALATDPTPRFDWSTTPRTDRYDLQVATDANFTLRVIDEEVTASEFTAATPLAPNTLYYWSVRALSALGQASRWSPPRILRTAVLPPGLLVPLDGSTPPSLRPQFDWSDVSGASRYRLQVSRSASFAPLALTAVVPSSHHVPLRDLPRESVFYWRVQSLGANGPSLWSAIFTLNTPAPPSVPVLRSPANGAIVSDHTPLLDWDDSLPGLHHYEVEISSDGFATALRAAPLASEYAPPDPLQPSTKHSWRVRAFGILGQWSAWSTVRTFRTSAARSGTRLPSRPKGPSHEVKEREGDQRRA